MQKSCQEERSKFPEQRVPVGQFIIAKPGNLSSKFVLFLVAPEYNVKEKRHFLFSDRSLMRLNPVKIFCAVIKIFSKALQKLAQLKQSHSHFLVNQKSGQAKNAFRFCIRDYKEIKRISKANCKKSTWFTPPLRNFLWAKSF